MAGALSVCCSSGLSGKGGMDAIESREQELIARLSSTDEGCHYGSQFL